jgi:N-acetylmuramoyl-L-alanine amidase
MAYLTNADEGQRAQSDDFQSAVAQGIYNAVIRFRSHLEAQRQP